MIPSYALNSLIRASAGTGKTFALSNQYIRLLVNGAHPKSILATTFTRKAAGEILDRIIERLALAANSDTVAKKTASELDRDDLTAARFGELLTSLIRDMNHLQVETLDAFFHKIAQAFSLDIGMPAGWEIASDEAVSNLHTRAVRQALSSRDTVNILFDLAKGEAKSGISNLVNSTVRKLYTIFRETLDTNRLDAWHVLQEMPTLTDVDIESCLDALRNADLSDFNDRFRSTFEKDLRAIQYRDWDSLLKRGIFKKVTVGDFTFSRAELPAALVKLMRPICEHAVAININLLVRQTRGALEFLKRYHREYDELKASHAILEFDDVAYLASRLFNNYEHDRLAWRMDQNIDHLLLDEFQDTSIQQWKVLQPLASRVCQPGQQRSLFVVGDVKQAIYGWRGGVAEIFDEVQNEFSEQLDDQSTRSKSFRSSPAIIDCVNQVFENLLKNKKLEDQKPFFASWLEKFSTHQTERTAYPGHASFEVTHSKDTHYQEVAQRIKQISEEFPEHDLGVLVRENAAVAKIMFELGKLSVPACEEGGNPLTDAAAINLLLAALRIIDHPDDAIARFQLLNSRLGQSFQLTHDNFRQGNHPIRSVAQSLRLKLMQHGYGQLLNEWAKAIEPDCTEREWFRVGQLIEIGFSTSVADHPRTADFIEYVNRKSVPDPATARINVMTIHKSKGLEFDIVVLPELDFDKGQEPTYIAGRETPTSDIDLICRYMNKLNRMWLPEQFRPAFDQQLEKQIHGLMCTIYVALTRPKHGLHMIADHACHADTKTAAGLIMAALDINHHPKKNSKPGQILWQVREGQWNGATKIAEPTAETFADPSNDQPTKNFQAIRFAPSKTSRNLPWESPSSREGDSQVQLGRLLQLEDNRNARLQGSLIHACFEQVDWLDGDLPSDKELLQKLGKIEGADSASRKLAIRDFKRMLKKPNTSALLQQTQYNDNLLNAYDELQVDNERPFAVRFQDSILNGLIDRLVLLKKDGRVVAADVVDFKTDQIGTDPRALQNRVEVYRPQLKAYRDAVAKMFHLNPEDVSARLMFVAIDQQVLIA